MSSSALSRLGKSCSNCKDLSLKGFNTQTQQKKAGRQSTWTRFGVQKISKKDKERRTRQMTSTVVLQHRASTTLIRTISWPPPLVTIFPPLPQMVTERKPLRDHFLPPPQMVERSRPPLRDHFPPLQKGHGSLSVTIPPPWRLLTA